MSVAVPFAKSHLVASDAAHAYALSPTLTETLRAAS
jgi:hypothetical protein